MVALIRTPAAIRKSLMPLGKNNAARAGQNEDYLEKEIACSDAVAIEIAKSYRERHSVKWLFDRHCEFVIRNLKSAGAREILDLGCGMGNFVVRAVNRFDRVIGVNPGAESLEVARRLAPEAEFRLGQGESMPIEDSSIDAIVMKGVVHHLKDPIIVFREVARCLRPGGRSIVFEGNRSSPYRRAVLGVADLLGMHHEATQFKHHAPRIMKAMMREAGLQPIDCKSISGLFTPLALTGAGGPTLWRALGAIEDILQACAPILFNYHVVLTARKPSADESETASKKAMDASPPAASPPESNNP
jgi:ubiquinone/menaquinone biosynthesis C-methylase UbiE